MSVIIRLQNLPWSANSMDIRQFFRGLSIPDGGVNIVGGEKGDAFIAFSTDEDARQAMMKNGEKLKDGQISLLLSSRAEMQKVIEQARARTLSMMSGATPAPVVPAPTTAPVIPTAAPIVNTSIQPPVISLSGFLASNTAPAMRSSNVIEIPGLSNGYTTAAPSLLFNNLPSNMPTIVDTTGSERDKIVGKFGLNEKMERNEGGRSPRERLPRRSRRSRSDSSGSSRSRSRDRHSRSPRRNRYSRSPDRRRSRSPRSRRYRSRSPRDRYYRSSSRERSYDSDKGSRNSPPSSRSANNNSNRNFSSVWAVPPNILPQQQSNTTPVFQPYTTKSGAGVRSNDPRGIGENNHGFGRDVFGREIRNDRTEEPDACVKVENLEKKTGYGEVRRLFSGLFITNNGIKMINDEFGERTGIAFIRFAKRSDKLMALQRDGNVLRDRKLCIKDITDKEYDDAIDSCRPVNRHNDARRYGKDENETPDTTGPPFSCLKVIDLPPFAKEQDIIKIFSSFTIMQIVMGRNSKKIYEAYVKFYREDDAKQALLATPSFRMAHKFVMISKCSDLEFEAARNEYEFATTIEQESPEQVVEDTDEDKRGHKSPSPIQISSPTIEPLNNDPRSAIYGSNVVRSPVTRDPRFRNNNQNSNDGYSNGNSVQASPMINDYNSDSNQEQSSNPNNGTTSSNSYQSRDPRRRVDPRVQAQLDNSCYLLLLNVPLQLAEWDVSEWLESTGAEPTKIHLLLNSQRKFNGEVLCEFETPELAKKAATKDNQQLERNTVRCELIPKSRYEELMNVKPDFIENTPRQLPPQMDIPRQMPPFVRPGMNGIPPGMNRGPLPTHMIPPGMMNPGPGPRFGPGLDNMNDPNFNARVILMENIPYKAGPEDILDYFGPEFDLTPGSIMRRFNERGQPAGEAKVLFHSPADAKHAFNLRKGNKIMGRTVYLKPMI